MFSKIRTIVLAAAAVVIAGCLETKQEVTLNPDGSGKVIYESKKPLDIMGGMTFGTDAPAEEESMEDKAKKQVADIIKNSKGIDAWEDVSYTIEDDGGLRFKGTAYFKSYNDTAIGGSMKSENNSKVKIDKSGITVIWEKNQDKSGMVGGMPPEKTDPPKKLTEKELQAEVKKLKAQMKQSTAMMGPMLAGLKEEVTFHLPGKIDKYNNFKKVDDSTVTLSFDGETVLKVMQEFANDDEAIKKSIQGGQDLKTDGPGDDYFSEKIFGNSKPTEAHSPKGKQQFDYKKAVENAKKNFSAMCKKLGIEVK